MFWMCTRCETVHTQNSDECRECTATTFEPVAESDLQSSSSTGPKSGGGFGRIEAVSGE